MSFVIDENHRRTGTFGLGGGGGGTSSSRPLPNLNDFFETIETALAAS